MNKFKSATVSATEVGYKAAILLTGLGLMLVAARLLGWIDLLPTLNNALAYLTGIIGLGILAKSINKKDS